MSDHKYDRVEWLAERDAFEAAAERREALAADRRGRLRLFTRPLDSTEHDDPYVFESTRDRDNARMEGKR